MTILSSQFSSGVLDFYMVREIIDVGSTLLPTNVLTALPAYLTQFASPVLAGGMGAIYHVADRKTPMLVPNMLSGAPNASKLQGAAVGATAGAVINVANVLPVAGQITEPIAVLVGSQVGRMMG
jgi:hypothetical protein